MRYFGCMSGRMLAPVVAMLMITSVAASSATATGLSGDEVTVLITERLAAENLLAAPVIASNRIFPDCAGKVEILPMFGGWHTVNVACSSRSGWRFAIRANVSNGNSARTSDFRSGGDADSVSISGLVVSKKPAAHHKSAASVQVVALNRSVRKGDIITADDIALVKVAERNAIGAFKGDDNLVGRRLKSSLTTGTPLRRRHLEPDYMVFKDAEVIISSSAGVVNVDVVGIALENGQLGEWIKVQNASSGESVFAKVISEKKVTVVTKKS